mgnify:CR=1 FL=1
MKYIFLDIDGVMLPFTSIVDYPTYTLNNLAMIVEQTGAQIVLSSMWRFREDDKQEVKRQLAKVGLDFVDTTTIDMKKIWRMK